MADDKTPQTQSDPQQVSEKKARKLWILPVAAMSLGLLFGGGIAAGYFLFFAPNVATDTEVTEPGAGAPEAPAVFVALERLSAPLIAGDKVLGYVLLDLSLQLNDRAHELEVVQRLPVLRDAFLREVTRAPIGKEGQSAVVDFENLTERLKNIANQELRKTAVHRVLVTQSTRI